MALILLALAASVTALEPRKVPPAHKQVRHHKNRTVAFLAGAALHLSQDAAAMTRAAAKKRDGKYGHSDARTRTDRKHLRLIHKKSRYFKAVKRRSEGQR